jgi:hypothetical protein
LLVDVADCVLAAGGAAVLAGGLVQSLDEAVLALDDVPRHAGHAGLLRESQALGRRQPHHAAHHAKGTQLGAHVVHGGADLLEQVRALEAQHRCVQRRAHGRRHALGSIGRLPVAEPQVVVDQTAEALRHAAHTVNHAACVCRLTQHAALRVDVCNLQRLRVGGLHDQLAEEQPVVDIRDLVVALDVTGLAKPGQQVSESDRAVGAGRDQLDDPVAGLQVCARDNGRHVLLDALAGRHAETVRVVVPPGPLA